MLLSSFKSACGFMLMLTLVALLQVFPAFGQGEESDGSILVDEFERLGHCDFTSRIDNFLAELASNANHQGYVITYKSANELPGEKDIYARETMIVNHIAFRKFDSARITFVRGGYSSDHRTQLYRVPPGVAPPEPSRTVPAPKISDNKTFLYDKSVIGLYGGLGDEGLTGIDPEEFVLETVKAREAAEQAASDAEWEAEQRNSDPDSDPPRDEEPSESQDSVDERSDDVDAQYPEEKLSEEELLAQRFQWTEVPLAKFMSTRKKASAVLIFYADDERYDIARLRSHVEEGRNRLAAKGGIDANRVRVEFGGYRDSIEVEFWFVPANGKAPVPTPEERKPEEQHHH